jgi:hypothetical protein
MHIQLTQNQIVSTNFLINSYENLTTQQRYWHIKNNTYELVLCKNCKLFPSKFKKDSSYTKCCSPECAKKSMSISVKNTCMKLYGVSNPAKLKTVQDKMKQTCISKRKIKSKINLIDEKLSDDNYFYYL